MTRTTLATDGQTFEAVKSKANDPLAHAYCETCEVEIYPSPYWSLGKTVWLHRHGYNREHRISYARWECSRKCEERINERGY